MIFLMGVTAGAVYSGFTRIGKREKGFALKVFLGFVSVLVSFLVWFMLFTHYYPGWG